MTDRTDFFSQAFYTIARAIAEAGVNVDLFKMPETIAKSVNRRVRAELKRLAVLLRRLIFLMALQVKRRISCRVRWLCRRAGLCLRRL